VDEECELDDELAEIVLDEEYEQLLLLLRIHEL